MNGCLQLQDHRLMIEGKHRLLYFITGASRLASQQAKDEENPTEGLLPLHAL